VPHDVHAKGDETRREVHATPEGEEEAPKDAGAPLVASAVDAVGEPRVLVVSPTREGISPHVLRALVGQPAMQKRIRDVVARRLVPGVPPDLVDELVQRTSLAVLETTTWTPRSIETARAWIAGVAVRTVALYFRRESAHRRWINAEVDVVDVEDQAVPAADTPDGGWLVSDWLARAVANDARDQETLALLLYKARTEKSHEQVAEDHGITVPALKNRIHELKRKYAPRWQRRQRMILWLWLGGGALVVASGCVAWWLLHPERPVEPTPPPSPVLTPVEVPRPAPVDTRFRPAESAPTPTPAVPRNDGKPRQP
jgi:DNA-directed RNA polymerase specialized sigma24 family protein